MNNTDPTDKLPYFITFPTLEAAICMLCEKVLGARLAIKAPPAEPASITYETESDPEILRAQRDGWQEIAEVRGMRLDEASQGLETERMHRDATLDELENERMRLAACGVVACADTPESAVEARKMHREYYSASCRDVEQRVDECIELREKVKALTEQRDLYLRGNQNLEQKHAETEARWMDAVADAQLTRNGAEKVVADLLAYTEFTRNVAIALGMSTCEISFKEVLQRVAMARTGQAAALDTLMAVTAERNALNTLDKTTPT